METVTDFIFLGSKITADGDYSHAIKRHLLLEQKAMKNLDSILKRRDITLPTKICLVKAMVSPVVMYECESWTIKKAECQKLMLLNCGVGEDSSESLGVQGDQTSQSRRKSSEGLMLKLKLQNFGHLMWRADSLEKTLMVGKTEGKRRRGQQRMRWLDNIINSMDMNLSKFRDIVNHTDVINLAWRSQWGSSIRYTEKQQQGMPSRARPGAGLHPFYPHSVLRTRHRATS